MNGDRSHSHLFQNVIVGLTLVAGPMTTCWVGCSSTAIESELPARVTASADPIHRTIRPVPEVISRPKPFRLPDFVGAAAPGTEPVTMQSADMQPGSLLAGGSPEQPPGELLQRIKTQPAATEIREMMLGYLQAFNRHDSLALAAHWSSTGENVDLDSGATTAGRDAVEQVFSALFAEDAEATIDIEIDSIRPLRQDVAVVDGVTLITFTNEPPSSSRFSAVVVKQDGCWMLESVRESAQPLPLNSQHRPLDELGWLVGSWEDIGEGVTASTHCFWSTGKAFIIRSHAVTFDDLPSEHAAISEQTNQSEPEDSAGPAIPDLLVPGCGVSREITEIIGWDSQRRQIRSWIFTSDGQFAEGVWSRQGDRWTVAVSIGSGTLQETVSQTSIVVGHSLCSIVRIGADGISMRHSNDELVDVMPPACDFVRTARPQDIPLLKPDFPR